MNWRRRVVGVALVAAAGALLATAGPAGADPPVNAPNGGQITIHCDALGTLDIVGNGRGLWTRSAEPMHVVGSTQVLVAYAFHFEGFPTGGGTIVVDASKPAPKNGRLDVCRFSLTFPEGTENGTLGVSYTPA